MKEIAVDPKLGAYCGIYCGACPSWRRDRCPGCHENEKASWCKVRSCCIENEYASCADCTQFEEPRQCKKFHNFFSKVFGFILRSDRRACICQIKEVGLEGHAQAMAELGRPSIKP